MHWAWSLGIDGIDFQQEKKTAGRVGTACHECIDRYILGDDVPYNIEIEFKMEEWEAELVARGFQNFLKWWEPIERDCEIIATEVQLVCPEMRFGGTPDGIFRYRGEVYLYDWKTSGRLYDSYYIQLAAYMYLWNRYGAKRDCDKITGGCHLVRFDKDNGAFDQSYRDMDFLERRLKTFFLMRELYDEMKRVGA